MNYKIADLSEDQKNQLLQVEDQLGVVLIAWEDSQHQHQNTKKADE